MQLFLFITGKAFAGKDTLFHYLNDRYDNIYQSSFAMEVKKEFCRLNPHITLESLLTDPIIKAKCRGQLIEIGDGYREKHGSNIWVEKHYNSLCSDNVFQQQNTIQCITDTRYHNEIHDYPQFIMKQHPTAICLRIKVLADLSVRLKRMGKVGAENYLHYGLYSRSECELDAYKCDIEISNNNNWPGDKKQIMRDLDSKAWVHLCPILSTLGYPYYDEKGNRHADC